jgi:hypothetical protein
MQILLDPGVTRLARMRQGCLPIRHNAARAGGPIRRLPAPDRQH